MNYFYSASVMGYGAGRKWHKNYNFPNFPRVTKTLTWKPKYGVPFAILKFGDTIWNRVGLHNIGILNWKRYYMSPSTSSNTVVSLAGTDYEIESMVYMLKRSCIAGIELNFSCPNHRSFNNKNIPKSNHPIYLKLRHDQDPYKYDLDNVAGIRLNSVPWVVGGLSGKAARKHNWVFIERFNKEGLNVAGCSFVNNYDLFCLKELGCKEVGIGSTILTNPKLIERLG